MGVPFVDLGPAVDLIAGDERRRLTAGEVCYDFEDEVTALVNGHEFVGSTTVGKLEDALCKKLSVVHAIACGSGTDALVLALMAAGIGHGSLVAVPNLTFWATYEAVVRVGATPVLIDVDDSLQLDLDELSRVHRRFDAAILVHLFGWASPRLQEIRDYCVSQRITLIEDGAQAFGVLDSEGRSVFEGAYLSTLSFYPAKIIGGIGDGGAVFARHPRVAARARALANHGRSGHYVHDAVGLCSRMSGIEAAWLLRAVEKSDEIIDGRKTALARYTQLPGDFGWTGTGVEHSSNAYLHVAHVDDRDAVRAKLAERGIETAITYPITIADQRGAEGAQQIGSLRRSREFCKRVLNLPLFYGITDSQINEVVSAVKEVMK